MSTVNITKRIRRRVQRDGTIRVQTRWVVSIHENDPGTHRNKRSQRFFASRVEAIEFRDALIKGRKRVKRSAETVGGLVEAWLASKQKSISPAAFSAYSYYAKQLTPLCRLSVDKLTTKAIREWHGGTCSYSANRALRILRTVLSEHAENTGTAPMLMPTGLNKSVPKQTKRHLSIEQVRTVIAKGDIPLDKRIYVSMPFLTGLRISELLGLCWDAVDIEAGTIRVFRTQDKMAGELRTSTKTSAGQRIVPMSATLRRLLEDWHIQCPSTGRVLPAPRGGRLLYADYLHRYWRPALERLGLPYVNIHSARASYISLLQEAGAPVSVAAKLAGHSNPSVTMSYYSHALSDGVQAVQAFDELFAR